MSKSEHAPNRQQPSRRDFVKASGLAATAAVATALPIARSAHAAGDDTIGIHAQFFGMLFEPTNRTLHIGNTNTFGRLPIHPYDSPLLPEQPIPNLVRLVAAV